MGPRLIYTGSPLDRVAERRADVAWVRELLSLESLRVVPVWRDKNLVGGTRLPEARHLVGPAARALLEIGETWVLLGIRDNTPHVAVDLSAHEPDVFDAHIPDEADFLDLRATGGQIEAGEAPVLALARGLMYWHRTHQFCPNCGSRTRVTDAGHVRRCTNESCGRSHFPRTDPAVIMLVSHLFPDGVERCLMGWSTRWDMRMYSTLAGFVEPGESLEEAVAREVWEESGVPVTDVVYKGSQPWPFPASIMLGFRARALSSELNIDEEEMRECRWFSRGDLHAFGEFHDDLPPEAPRLPRKDSIARFLIEDWLQDAG